MLLRGEQPMELKIWGQFSNVDGSSMSFCDGGYFAPGNFH